VSDLLDETVRGGFGRGVDAKAHGATLAKNENVF
jgi:hypothetical protein